MHWLQLLFNPYRRKPALLASATFEGLKRRLFLVGLGLGTAYIAFDTVIQIALGEPPQQQTLIVGLGVCLLVLALVLWRKPSWQAYIELAALGLSALYLLYNFYTDFVRAQQGVELNLSVEVLQNAQWLLVIYLGSFILFSSEWGLRLSAIIYVTSLSIGLAFMLPRWLNGQVPDGSYSLFQFYVASAIILVFLYGIGSLRQRFALVDFLTGLSNRRYLYEALQSEMERARRYKPPFSIILFDIDHFKQVNDAHGHVNGDFVLKEVARLVVERLRVVDEVGRWGGEEFLILLPETGLNGAQQLAEHLRQMFANHAFGSVGQVTASFGVAHFLPNDTPETLLHRADVALYEAKREGRNQVRVGQLVAETAA